MGIILVAYFVGVVLFYFVLAGYKIGAFGQDGVGFLKFLFSNPIFLVTSLLSWAGLGFYIGYWMATSRKEKV